MFEITKNPYLHEEILTLSVILLFFILRTIFNKLITKFAKINEVLENRTNLIIKYINILLGLLCILTIIIIWGVKKDQIFLFVSSVFAVVGVASFAQWSLISNITAGIIMFFSFPFKIGDTIRILDKEVPIEGEIIDIKAFYILIKTTNGEFITYPNNLLMQKGIAIVNNENEH